MGLLYCQGTGALKTNLIIKMYVYLQILLKTEVIGSKFLSWALQLSQSPESQSVSYQRNFLKSIARAPN